MSAAVRTVFELASRRTPREAVLESEKPKISHGPAPARLPRGPHQRLVAKMDRGAWVVVSQADAKAIVAAAKALGGQATSYQVSELQSCVKILEAPWAK